MLDFDLIKNILIIAIASGVITTALVQKIKEGIDFKNSKLIILLSFIVSMVIGTLFAFCFSDIKLLYCLWTGLFSFIGADVIYKSLEDKIFKSFSDIQQAKTVKIPIENKIETGDQE